MYMEKEKTLEEDINDCQIRLERAQSLISSLATEKVRWAALIEKYTNDIVYLLGDVLLSSSIITYLSPFAGVKRQEMQVDWI